MCSAIVQLTGYCECVQLVDYILNLLTTFKSEQGNTGNVSYLASLIVIQIVWRFPTIQAVKDLGKLL